MAELSTWVEISVRPEISIVEISVGPENSLGEFQASVRGTYCRGWYSRKFLKPSRNFDSLRNFYVYYALRACSPKPSYPRRVDNWEFPVVEFKEKKIDLLYQIDESMCIS